MMDVIAAHRRTLADALDTMTADQWRAPSLCAGWTATLSHDVIHGLDMTWPQDLAYETPASAMTTVLDAVTAPGDRTLFGFPLDGIRIAATDLDWSAGQGAELTGASRDLLPLLAGRAVRRELFAGPGAALAWSLAVR